MALSADLKVSFKDGVYESYLVKAAAQIYLGALVVVKANGYAYAGVNEAAAIFVGVSGENVLGVTDGVERVKVRRKGIALLTGAGLAITDVNSPVFLSNDGLITVTPNNVLVGVIVGVPDATHAWVHLVEGPIVDQSIATLTVAGAATVGTTLAVGTNATITGTLTATAGSGSSVKATVDASAGTIKIPAYTFATLPAATTIGRVIYVSDGSDGVPCLAYSDGTNWRAADDNDICSAS